MKFNTYIPSYFLYFLFNQEHCKIWSWH